MSIFNGWLTKRNLSSYLVEFPLLRILLFSFWFRLVFLGSLVAIFGSAMMLAKVWVVSPKNFYPEIRVSWLDYLQNWSLKRTAAKQFEDKDFKNSLGSWRSAWSNNLADRGSIHGLLDTLASLRQKEKSHYTLVEQASVWLLRLGETNTVDVFKCAPVWQTYGMDHFVVHWMDAYKDQLDPTMEMVYLKSLFRVDKPQLFGERVLKIAPIFPLDPLNQDELLKKDPEFLYYFAAYVVGWGPERTLDEREQLSAARRVLEKGKTIPEVQVLVNSLEMEIYRSRQDVFSYRNGLNQAEDWGLDTLNDHLAYWNLLIQSGRSIEAKQLVSKNWRTPSTAEELLQLANMNIAVGLDRNAIEQLEYYLEEFNWSDTVWSVLARLQLKNEDWDALHGLAVKIRNDPIAGRRLGGFSYYLDGRVSLHWERLEDAQIAFERSVTEKFENPNLGVATAKSLLQLGYPNEALGILLDLKEAFLDEPAYFEIMAEAASSTRNLELLRESAFRLYELAPDHELTQQYYCQALLVGNENPEEAIKFTLRLSNKYRENRILHLLHAIALLRNRRIVEAEAALQEMDYSVLTSGDKAQYCLAMFEIQVLQNRPEFAWRWESRIDRKELFMVQKVWLEETANKLPGRSDYWE